MTAPHPEAALSAREAEKTTKEALAEAVTFLEMDGEASKPGTDLYTWLKAVAQPILSTTPTATAGDGGERVRHVKRGTEYEVLGEAEAQVSGGIWIPAGEHADRLPNARLLFEGRALTVYRCATTGKLWCRLTDEFRDGRFETIAQAQTVQAPAGEDEPLTSAEAVALWEAEQRLAPPTPTDAQPKAAGPVGDEKPCHWGGGNDVIWCSTCGAEYAYAKGEIRPECPREMHPVTDVAHPTAARPVGDEALREAHGVANVMEALWLDAEQEAARLASGFWPSDTAIAEAFHEHRRETQPSLPPWSEVMEGSGIWQHSHNFATRLSSLRPSQQAVGEV